MGLKMMLNNVRGSFLVLGEPEQYQGKGAFRWSATALVPYNSDLAKKVVEALKSVARDKWDKKWESIYENIMSDSKLSCWIDGKRKEYDGYQGHWALTAHRYKDKGRPLVMDNDRSPIYRDDNEIYDGKGGRIYSGCFMNMQVEFWAQQNDNGKGLRATLLGVQRVKDGDAFGGGAAPDADDFGDVTDGADDDDLT